MITCHAYTNKLHTNLVSTQMRSLFKSNIIIVSWTNCYERWSLWEKNKISNSTILVIT
jgi:hypothetical protein